MLRILFLFLLLAALLLEIATGYLVCNRLNIPGWHLPVMLTGIITGYLAMRGFIWFYKSEQESS